jgi:mRNA-degrading endonuclease RelE of RelBE toxin-antitoxin system
MAWIVKIPKRASKQIGKLPSKVAAALDLLVWEIEQFGPVRSGWHHYGKLKGRPGCHHCHLNKGKPRYVAVWQESCDGIKLVEIRYVGTHEKAPY